MEVDRHGELKTLLCQGVYADCRLRFGTEARHGHKRLLQPKCGIVSNWEMVSSMSDESDGAEQKSSVQEFVVLPERFFGYSTDAADSSAGSKKRQRVAREEDRSIESSAPRSWSRFVDDVWDFLYGFSPAPFDRWFDALSACAILDRLLYIRLSPTTLRWTDNECLPPLVVTRSHFLSVGKGTHSAANFHGTVDTVERICVVEGGQIPFRTALGRAYRGPCDLTGFFQNYFRKHCPLWDVESSIKCLESATVERLPCKGYGDRHQLRFVFSEEILPNGRLLIVPIPAESKLDLRIDLSRHFARALFGVQAVDSLPDEGDSLPHVTTYKRSKPNGCWTRLRNASQDPCGSDSM